jgi:hypothetical protein
MMGWISVSNSDRSKKLTPAVRAYAAASGKRFQCDWFGFWRQCGRAVCRRRRSCTGDPHDCFSRHHAAMPRDHAAWLHAEILSRTTGTGTAERALRAVGLSLPGHVQPEPESVPPSRQADAAAPVVPEPASEASPSDRRQAELLAKLKPEVIATLKMAMHKLGTTPDADEPQEVEWSPMTGSAEDPVRMARLPSPPDFRSADVSPASPTEADAGAAGPSPPIRPPGVEPWQAWCDDEGRLHMPDPAAVNERFRMLTRSEIHERMRAYGSVPE